MASRAHTRQAKYDLWPYKRHTTGGSITENYTCVHLTMMDLLPKSERDPSRNVASRAHTRQQSKYDLWPCKRRTTGASKIQFHRKFESNPSRNGAARARTKMWRGGHGGAGGTLLNPKYPPAVSCRGIQWFSMQLGLGHKLFIITRRPDRSRYVRSSRGYTT